MAREGMKEALNMPSPFERGLGEGVLVQEVMKTVGFDRRLNQGCLKSIDSLHHSVFAALRRGLPWVAYAFLSAPAAYAEAPKQDAAIQQVLRKAQGALRQLAEEKTALEAQKTALEAEKAALQEKADKLEATVKQLEPLQGEVVKQKAAVEALKSANAALESQLASGREREQGLHGKIKEIVAQAKKIQGDNQLLVEAVKEREQWISQCSQKNQAMLETNGELVRLYQDKGFWDKVGDLEPLTGIAKVNTENTAQDYHFKLQDLKVTPFESELPAQKQAEAAASDKPQPAPDADEEAGE